MTDLYPLEDSGTAGLQVNPRLACLPHTLHASHIISHLRQQQFLGGFTEALMGHIAAAIAPTPA